MTIYKVNDIYGCIQGEGVQTGVPMVLLRLHGCPVGCSFCDTKETWTVESSREQVNIADALGVNTKWANLSASEIAAYIAQTFSAFRWVLVTGGEPAVQDLEALVNALHDAGYKVALETSGTAIGHLPAPFDWVCVSPKIDMPGGLPILADAIATADEIKMVIGRQADLDKLDNLLTDFPTKDNVTVCLQPISQSERATQLCIETVQSRNWRLSIQTHKYIGLP